MIKEMLPSIAYSILQIYMIIVTSYFVVTGILGFRKPKQLPNVEPNKRFLILVPAHNEASVIGGIAENLKHLDYPDELYDAIIIADGCTDDTATIVRKIGLKALEHTYLPGEHKGKPYAIRYALEQISDYEARYDGVCICDADNLVSLNFLKEMNKHLSAGQQLVQCYLDTKNPMGNWVSLSFATNFYYMNRSCQLARTHWKLGASLGGTGFCIGTKLLKKIGWTANSLTEDLEFQIQTVLGGEKAHWCHTARVYDEKPTSFKASCEQRSRWARGHWELIFKFAPSLLVKAIKERSIIALDTLFYSLNPLHMLVGGIMMVFGAIALAVGYPLNSLIPIHPMIRNILMIIPYILIVFSILKDVQKPKLKLLGAIAMPIFNLTYIPIVFWALLTRKNRIWKRTEHSKNIALDLELDAIKVKNKN
ncbi:hypothetical protein AZF37_08335 [endosymbiont 'TC1' of Trimyema compressum]|uniref:glycosyltransferase family 2 protein n=1 Tax=endosymbiont 'TC1' of Trimyema compressum TaxID=243899 RepID=UPI0007F152FE|nr:glycosyltransferase family 2 protein [endosymbiont 'TC1' of Trimyema compressum]AMP21163.1 hypothetical protein AZF37_08335 [endosymbiont 'TC1' of Trimyema compressum]